MKKEQLFYWLTTLPVCALMVMSATMYFSQSPEVMEGIKKIGFPYFFILMLGVAKSLGVLAILYPRYKKITEWAYAGFTFTFIGAIWTHISTGTPFVMAAVVLLLLLISYRYKDQNFFAK